MEDFDGALTEQVRLHRHLYDPSSREHRDYEIIGNSWKEIAVALGKDESICRRTWKNLRDRFVKAKRKTKGSSGHPGRKKAAPVILQELEWLSQFVTHRDAETNTDKEAEVKQLSSKGFRPLQETACLPANPNMQEVVLKRLQQIAHDRDSGIQRGNPCHHFGVVVADKLSRIHPDHRDEVEMQISQLLFDALKKYPL
ncbi:uncharacterized protein LOC110368284 [Fundulus heteroclitus]|uniref:uncharacterized protein LOC110368284 n=1 Tax=Fundulus heteroclitus TaxID=8078 RepID=UPI00165C8160|nr:uncharacterized protein LOC110368284 [Fundulus heteroclitus]